MRWEFKVALWGLILSLAALLNWSSARAHDWYPISCCNDIDCAPLADGEVTMNSKGYYIARWHLTIPYASTNSSQDQDYHICLGQETGALMYGNEFDPVLNRSNVCFFAPDTGA